MENFFDKDLLVTKYIKSLKVAYENTNNYPFLNPYRSPDILLEDLNAIYQYNKNHARSYVKRLKNDENDFRNCESIFTEIIVYTYYLNLLYEGIVNSLHLYKADYDLKLDIHNGKSNFLEIFSIMPNIKIWTKDELEKGKIEATEIRTHLQEPSSSIRQKLLGKIKEQGQLLKRRRNFAVIELNSPIIADDFTILSSLSNGYKIAIDTNNMRKIGEGFDWSKSVFDEPFLSNLVGIIYFKMGDYNHRKFILNPNYNGD